MKTYNVYITLHNGKEISTQMCGKDVTDASIPTGDYLIEDGYTWNDVSTCLFEQTYNSDDHEWYGDDYEW